eukprot:1799981-Amphidinium_carterae.1
MKGTATAAQMDSGYVNAQHLVIPLVFALDAIPIVFAPDVIPHVLVEQKPWQLARLSPRDATIGAHTTINVTHHRRSLFPTHFDDLLAISFLLLLAHALHKRVACRCPFEVFAKALRKLQSLICASVQGLKLFQRRHATNACIMLTTLLRQSMSKQHDT